MDKLEAMGLLKKALEEVPNLRTLNYDNHDFPAWKGKVGKIMEAAYGSESHEFARFTNAPGKRFVVRAEMGLQDDYAYQLDCYESVLKSLTGKA